MEKKIDEQEKKKRMRKKINSQKRFKKKGKHE